MCIWKQKIRATRTANPQTTKNASEKDTRYLKKKTRGLKKKLVGIFTILTKNLDSECRLTWLFSSVGYQTIQTLKYTKYEGCDSIQHLDKIKPMFFFYVYPRLRL